MDRSSTDPSLLLEENSQESVQSKAKLTKPTAFLARQGSHVKEQRLGYESSTMGIQQQQQTQKQEQ